MYIFNIIHNNIKKYKYTLYIQYIPTVKRASLKSQKKSITYNNIDSSVPTDRNQKHYINCIEHNIDGVAFYPRQFYYFFTLYNKNRQLSNDIG